MTVQTPMNLLKFILNYDNTIRVSGLNLFIQRSAVKVPWQRHMSHTTIIFSYWARKNMVATCLQWSPYDTINWLLTFSNSLLVAVVTLHCVCLRKTTQHKLQEYIYIYIKDGNMCVLDCKLIVMVYNCISNYNTINWNTLNGILF